MKGYWNCPDATAEVLHNGWLLTGDLARIDEDSYFFIVLKLDRIGLRSPVGGLEQAPPLVPVPEIPTPHHRLPSRGRNGARRTS
jgi:hypothetical protein